MSAPKQAELWLGENGEILFIHDDSLAAFVSAAVGGDRATRRASHVDQWDDLTKEAQEKKLGVQLDQIAQWHIDLMKNRWFADMTPVGGPVLGPFETRTVALQQEIAWIQRNRNQVIESFPDARRTSNQPERDLRDHPDQRSVPEVHTPGGPEDEDPR